VFCIKFSHADVLKQSKKKPLKMKTQLLTF